jgi:uncharacterized membrane protein
MYAGLEVALLVWAFWWIGRTREREEITVDGDAIVLASESRGRAPSVRRFNREWAVLVVRERGVRFDMWLRYGGKHWPLATLATDVERSRVAARLTGFVRTVRE